jgi:hypothetical protein
MRFYGASGAAEVPLPKCGARARKALKIAVERVENV